MLRSGKAKKTDAPIPTDLAPISGSGKRAAKKEPEEAMVLESIKFRYSTDTIAEERQAVPAPQAEEEPAQPAEETAPRPPKPRRDNRRKPRRERPEGQTEEAGESKPENKPRPLRRDNRPNRPRRENKPQGEEQKQGYSGEAANRPRNYWGYRKGPKPQDKGEK